MQRKQVTLIHIRKTGKQTNEEETGSVDFSVDFPLALTIHMLSSQAVDTGTCDATTSQLCVLDALSREAPELSTVGRSAVGFRRGPIVQRCDALLMHMKDQNCDCCHRFWPRTRAAVDFCGVLCVDAVRERVCSRERN